jgi:hypothetical protein
MVFNEVIARGLVNFFHESISAAFLDPAALILHLFRGRGGAGQPRLPAHPGAAKAGSRTTTEGAKDG